MNQRIFASAALAALTLAGLACAAPSSPSSPSAPVRVILVGDSTMASKSGYGDALCARFTPQVSCVNLARGGRSSKSFRAEGRWDEVERMLKDGSAATTYVLVQFGHNDQPGKAPRSTDLVTEFPANMARYAQEVKALGGVPVLVTPLTRRSFKGDWLRDDLAPWAAATRKVAQQEGAVLLDLNADSAAAVQAMGQQEADTLAMAPPPAAVTAPADPNKVEVAGAAKSAFDRTHLGTKGADYFARMVERELVQAIPATRPYFIDGAKP
jgi:lysophospholipase L1-like esterase